MFALGVGPEVKGSPIGPTVGPPWACEAARERPKQPLTTVVWRVPPDAETVIASEALGAHACHRGPAVADCAPGRTEAASPVGPEGTLRAQLAANRRRAALVRAYDAGPRARFGAGFLLDAAAAGPEPRCGRSTIVRKRSPVRVRCWDGPSANLGRRSLCSARRSGAPRRSRR